MKFDIRTLLAASSLVVMVSAFILTMAWRSEKHMRTVMGFWGLGQALLGTGMILLSYQKVIPDFFGMVISNACTATGYVVGYEGVTRYIGKKGHLRGAMLLVLTFIIASMWYFTFVYPSTSHRIMTYSYGAIVFSLIFVFTLVKSSEIKETPIKLLAATHAFQIVVMSYRALAASSQGEYADFLNSGVLQGAALLALLAYSTSQALCYFWLIAHRLGIELQKQVVTDALTGLYNRRALEEHLGKLLATRTKSNLGLLIIDIDNFKDINDVYGHQAGDLYLKEISSLFIRELSREDKVYRYAGDEFVIVICDSDSELVRQKAETVRKSVNSLFVPWDDRYIHTTISVGFTMTNSKVNNIDALIHKADKALYKIKGLGGDDIASDL